MDNKNIYDIIIIGSGPGGYVAAIRAAQLGQKVAIIEAQELGGVCLNWGCIPTKALLRSTEILNYFHHAKTFGLKADNISFDLKSIVQRSRDVSQKLSQGVQSLIKKNKITVYKGYGKLSTREPGGLHSCNVQDSETQKQITLQSKNVIIATGAKAKQLPNLKVDGQFIWTAKEAMIPDKLPKKLAILGSGAIGIEFASFYRGLGSEVTVIEMKDTILPVEDREISALAQKMLMQQGINILMQSTIEKSSPQKNHLELIVKTPKGEQQLSVDQLIIAIGIVGNTEDLGLEHTKVNVVNNQITINEYGQTHEPGIYAIGDVAGAPWLAHKASHEGIVVAEKIAGLKVHPLNKKAIPGCTYSTPQIASIGITEEQANLQNVKVKIGRFPFYGNGKAIALGETDGLMKVIFEATTGELLGAHMVGHEVTELIQGFSIALACEATEAELMHTIFPHPTLSEMVHEATLNAYGRTIHL